MGSFWVHWLPLEFHFWNISSKQISTKCKRTDLWPITGGLEVNLEEKCPSQTQNHLVLPYCCSKILNRLALLRARIGIPQSKHSRESLKCLNFVIWQQHSSVNSFLFFARLFGSLEIPINSSEHLVCQHKRLLYLLHQTANNFWERISYSTLFAQIIFTIFQRASLWLGNFKVFSAATIFQKKNPLFVSMV